MTNVWFSCPMSKNQHKFLWVHLQKSQGICRIVMIKLTAADKKKRIKFISLQTQISSSFTSSDPAESSGLHGRAAKKPARGQGTQICTKTYRGNNLPARFPQKLCKCPRRRLLILAQYCKTGSNPPNNPN